MKYNVIRKDVIAPNLSVVDLCPVLWFLSDIVLLAIANDLALA